MAAHPDHSAQSLSIRAYREIRRLIVRLELAPGDVVDEAQLQARLGIGRTPIREALQRLARDQFVVVLPRRGMYVAHIDVEELPLLYETRAVLEPFAARLACHRGAPSDWSDVIDDVERGLRSNRSPEELLEVDRRCHRVVWELARNRFLTDTLDMLYAQSDRVWHMYLADVADTRQAVDEHLEILRALQARDAERAARLMEQHVRSFDAQVRSAIASRLAAE